MFVNTHKFQRSETILPNTKENNVYLEIRIITIGAELTLFEFPKNSFSAANLLSQKISCLRDSTAVYRPFVNENAFFQATIDNLSLCYVFQALPTDALIVY